MKSIYERIGLMESDLSIIEKREFADDLNLELVPVVYEWASKKVAHCKMFSSFYLWVFICVSAVCENYAVDESTRGYNRKMHSTVERNYLGCAECR